MELIFLISVSLVLLFFGISALKSKTESKTNQYFLLFVICAIAWIFSNYFSNSTSNYSLALISNRLIFITTSALVWVLFLFASVYPDSQTIIKKRYYVLSALFTIIVILLDISPYVVKTVTLETNYSSINFGFLISVYISHLLLFLFLFLYILLKKFFHAVGTIKIQLQYLLLGMGFTLLGVIITNLILPIVFEVFDSSRFGPSFLLILIGFAFVSIIRHRFLGIKVLIGQIIYFFILSVFNLLFFFLFIVVAENFFGGIVKTNTILIALLIFPIYTWIYSKFNNYIYTIIDKKFVYRKNHPTEILNEFVKLISTELDVDQIAIHVISSIKKFLGLEKVAVVLFNSKNKILYKRLTDFKITDFTNILKIAQYWVDIDDNPMLIREEITKNIKEDNNISERLKKIVIFMETNEIELILPLNRKVQLNGILLIGAKDNLSSFSVNELNFLENISANTSVAMGRALLFKEVENLNMSLNKKVSEQTKELRKKVKQLEDARSKEADMIDIMGHELRTPMSVVKLNTDLLQNFTENVMKRKEDFIKYVRRIKDAVETEITLINTLLSSAKLEGDKIGLNPVKVNIIEQIKMALHAQETKAKRKGLELKTNFSPTAQNVYADHARTIEILNNLIDNAVKYTEKGSVTVTTQEEGKYIKISVVDTGRGMTKDDVSRLGSKFFRTSNYIKSDQSDDFDIVRPGGSGLGLYVTFNLVKRMGGEIHVESELNKGTSFIFTLPKYTGQKAKNGSDSKDMFERLGLKKEKDSITEIQQ